jgi:hypothetical protein
MVRQTGKQRSQRIQIDYYRQRGRLDVGRNVCAVVGLVAAGLYAVYVVTAGGSTHVMTGSVAQAHAAFESDCQECHLDFTPIDSQAVKIDLPFANIRSAESIAHLESACQKCHAVGNHHRESMNLSGQLSDQNCGLCHVEHMGRDHDLVLVSSRKCQSCHGDLSDVCATTSIRDDVSAFTKVGHGDFASLNRPESSLNRPDPGRVKFDHRQHLLPGQVNKGERGGSTIGMLDETMRRRYLRAGQDDSSLVQLDCASCHQLAGVPVGGDRLSADAELGRYMAPISYEQHCAACHPMNPGMATADTTPLPHAVPWSKIELLLKGALAGARASGQSRSPGDDSQSSPQPGEGFGSIAAATSLVVAGELAAARERVESQCLQCHDRELITDERIVSAASSDPLIPSRWFKRGLYDHAAHRHIDCKYCHERAYPSNGSAEPPEDHETVMIAGIDSCTGCHRDAETATPASISSPDVVSLLGGQSTWASDACTLCHRYHAGREAKR